MNCLHKEQNRLCPFSLTWLTVQSPPCGHLPCPAPAHNSRELQVHPLQASGVKFRDQPNYREQDPLRAPPHCDRKDGVAPASAAAKALSGRGAGQWCSCPREPLGHHWPASAGRKNLHQQRMRRFPWALTGWLIRNKPTRAWPSVRALMARQASCVRL